jgi:hypothetical protein
MSHTPHSKHPALGRIASLCRRAHDILAGYYDLSPEEPDFDAFLLSPREVFGNGGAVLLEEDEDETGEGGGALSLGLCFGTGLADGLLREEGATLQTVAVVAEETSHFLTLAEAARRDVGVSRLELETLGEIDRFLALLHWNQNTPVSARSLCDAMFEGHRFAPGTQLALYVEAEARAFLHLRRAFADVWENRAIDTQRINSEASRYLRDVRENMLRASPARRRAA